MWTFEEGRKEFKLNVHETEKRKEKRENRKEEREERCADFVVWQWDGGVGARFIFKNSQLIINLLCEIGSVDQSVSRDREDREESDCPR